VNVTVRLVIVAVLVLLSAFFSASETALTAVNRIRLKHKAENGSADAARVLELLKKYDRVLTTLLIGNNVVNLAASSLATVLAITVLKTRFGGYEVLIATTALTVAVIIFGEILPKTLAREHSEGLLLTASRLLLALFFILTPLSALMLFLQKGAAKLFRNDDKSVSVTEEELMHIIDEIEDEGVLEEHESRLVRSALELDETTVGEILTPRVNIVAVAVTDGAEKARRVFTEEGYSRLPVYDKTIDRIVGIVNIKDFTRKFAAGPDFDMRAVTQEVLHIPALMKLSEALKLMQKEKSHLAVVVDQYGGTEGIVTLEDILEELVGEIWDEGDEETLPVKFINADVFEVSGSLSNNDLNRFFESKEPDVAVDSESNTVGGWVFELFGKIPEVGESVASGNLKITVTAMDGRRIAKIRAEILR